MARGQRPSLICWAAMAAVLVGEGREQSMYELQLASVERQEFVLGVREVVRIEASMPDIVSIEAQLQLPPSQLQGMDRVLSNGWLMSLSGVIFSR